MSTKVIFRTWKDTGEVIAFFPDMDEGRGRIGSYMHVGQYSGADYWGLLPVTRPATFEEYGELLEELQWIGYDDLVVTFRLNRRRRAS